MAKHIIDEIDCIINGINKKNIGYTVQQYNKKMKKIYKENDKHFLNKFLQFISVRSFEELINFTFNNSQYIPESHRKALHKELLKRYRLLIN